MLDDRLISRLMRLDASSVRDTFEGGLVAHHAQIAAYDLLREQKPRAFSGWLWADNHACRKRHPPLWPKEKKELFVRLWLSGTTKRELSIRFRLLGPGSVDVARKRLGLKASVQHRRWAEWEDKTLRELAVQGSAPYEIGSYLKRTPGAVTARAAKLGIREFTRDRLWQGVERAI